MTQQASATRTPGENSRGPIRAAQIATPDQQLEQILNTPGISPAQADFARDWTKRETERRANFGLAWVKDAKARTEDRSATVSKDMYDDRQEILALVEQAKAGDFDDSDDLMTTAKLYRNQIVGYERAIAAIETTEETIALVEEDPASYFKDFYGKYPTLAERVPTLSQALAERG